MTTPNVCDVVLIPSRHGEQRYRVDGYYKAEQLTKAELQASMGSHSETLLLQVKLARITDAKRAGKVAVVNCSKDEAEFVSAYGLCGTMARIEDVKIIGRVNWPEEDVAEEVSLQEEFIGRLHQTVDKYWEVE